MPSLISGRERLSGALASGYFIAPAVFSNVANSMTMAREEILGPVAAVIPFEDTAEEARSTGQCHKYGLGSGVWSTNVNTVMRMVRGIRGPVNFGSTAMD